MVFKVTGMSCMHCVARVKKALEAVEGVKSADVDLGTGKATLEGEFDVDKAIAAVKALKFDCKLDA